MSSSLLVNFEYPVQNGMYIEKLELIDIAGEVLLPFVWNEKEKKWCVSINVNKYRFIYKFLLNDYVYLNDPYANDFLLIDGEVWASRCQEKKGQHILKEKIEEIEYVFSNQMSNSVRTRDMKKIFYSSIDSKVVVGVELRKVLGIHELILLWYDSNRNLQHIDYQIVQPKDGQEEYTVVHWFQMLPNYFGLEEKYRIWEVKIVLDGQLFITDFLKITRQISL